MTRILKYPAKISIKKILAKTFTDNE